jgi:hypothetical protein
MATGKKTDYSWPIPVCKKSHDLGCVFREEKGLEKRFGPEYIEYKKHVPRWFPRTTPWTGTH